jgi:hypothetical protein
VSGRSRPHILACLAWVLLATAAVILLYAEVTFSTPSSARDPALTSIRSASDHGPTQTPYLVYVAVTATPTPYPPRRPTATKLPAPTREPTPVRLARPPGEWSSGVVVISGER